MSQGRVYWITGLSGTGKSTLAKPLQAALQAKGRIVIMLDGDVIREVFDLKGFDAESRLKIAYFNAKMCQFLAGQGMDVICATISLFHEVQAWNRAHIAQYTEILMDAPLEVLEARDPKGIYARARKGELHHVVGIHLAPELPHKPDFSFLSDGSVPVERMVDDIIKGVL